MLNISKPSKTARKFSKAVALPGTPDQARLNPDQIHAVRLNGASCRNSLVVPAFREVDIFGNAETLDKGDLDLAVARGAMFAASTNISQGKQLSHGARLAELTSAPVGTVTQFLRWSQMCIWMSHTRLLMS